MRQSRSPGKAAEALTRTGFRLQAPLSLRQRALLPLAFGLCPGPESRLLRLRQPCRFRLRRGGSRRQNMSVP